MAAYDSNKRLINRTTTSLIMDIKKREIKRIFDNLIRSMCYHYLLFIILFKSDL
jgi:hypothetical protein